MILKNKNELLDFIEINNLEVSKINELLQVCLFQKSFLDENLTTSEAIIVLTDFFATYSGDVEAPIFLDKQTEK